MERRLGTFLRQGETLAEAVDRSLRDKATVRGLHPRQRVVARFPEPLIPRRRGGGVKFVACGHLDMWHFRANILVGEPAQRNHPVDILGEPAKYADAAKRLIDRPERDENPNLDFVLLDTVRVSSSNSGVRGAPCWCTASGRTAARRPWGRSTVRDCAMSAPTTRSATS